MKRDYIILSAGRVLQIFVALAAMRLMTHLLSGSEVGNVYLVLSVTSYFSLVLLSPVGLYMTRRLNDWHKERRLLDYFACYNLYVLAVSLSVFPVLYLVKKAFGIGTGMSTLSLCLLAGGYIYAGTWNSTIIPALNMLHHRKSFVFFSTATLLLSLAFSVSLVKASGATSTMWISGQIFGLITLAAASLYYFQHKVEYGVNFPGVWETIKNPGLQGITKFSFPLLVTTFFMWMQNQSYRLVLERNIGLDFLGRMAVGLGIAAAIAAAAESLIQQIYQPIYYAEINTQDVGARKAAWDKMAGTIIPIYLLTTLFVSFLSWLIVTVLVDAKFHAVWVFTVFGAWVEFARITTNIFSNVAHSEMRTGPLAKPYVFGGVFTAGGVYLASLSAGYSFWVPVTLVLSGFVTLFFMIAGMRRILKLAINFRAIKMAMLLALPFPAGLLVRNNGGSIVISFAVLLALGLYFMFAQYLLYRKAAAVREGA